MATQNLRIDNGLSVGEIVIDATNNTITGLTTSAPSADGDVANKKYVDDSISSATTINAGNSSVVVADSGTGTITVTADGGSVASFAAANTTITASNNINLTATGDVVIPANVGITFGTGEKIEGDNTDLTVTSGGAINLTAVTDVVIPANVGITFGSGEKIEGNNTDLTVTSGAKINLTATSDVQIPNDVGVLFGTGGEKIESDGTDLTITSTGALQLTVTGTTTVSGALTVTGNLTVNGTTTTVNSTNTTIDDNLLELNSGAASNANDCGIIIERGSTGNNAIFMWDESADKFTLGTTTATASTTGDITITTGTLVAATFEGNLTGAVTGNASTATTLQTARTIGGVSFNGGANINLPGVNTAGNQSTSGTAAIATTVTLVATNTTNAAHYITFVDSATGNEAVRTDTNLTYNPSTNVLTTTASAAQYSDIAERYEADEELGFGTVVTIGGSKEITSVDSELSDTVFGVISKQPAYMMNSDAGSDETHPFVAVAGRTPVKVIGAITKGQRIVSSSTRGVARAVTESDTINPFHVLGRALESKTDEAIGMVNCVVRINN